MKILIATTYIYDTQWPEFTRNKTGFGMMVNDIFRAIGEKEEVYLTSHVVTKGHGESILKHTVVDVLLSTKLKDLIQGVKWFFKYKQNFKARVQYLYYCINKGYVRKQIKSIKPDVVHIHGLGYATKTFIEVCEELKVPYVVTLHGLIGLNDTVSAEKWDKLYEKEFLVKAECQNIPVTVISTGMKKRIEENYLHHSAQNISVITNGTRIPFDPVIIDGNWNLKKRFNLTDGCRIGVVVGSICERKNQIKVIEAVAELPEIMKEKCVIFLCGTDCMGGEIQRTIEKYQLQKNIYVLGFLSRDILSYVLDQADFNVVASKDEGFGLSIIEAYSHGLPTVTFSDIDAIIDLFNEKAMVLAEKRSTKELSLAMQQLLEMSWDKKYIKNLAHHFLLTDMADKYEKEYRHIINREGVLPIELTYDYIYIQRKLGKKILVCVGNISDNKNQIQAVRTMEGLNDAVLILLGRECDGGIVRKYIIDNKLEKKVILSGFCDDMNPVWLEADLNLFLSKNDGFGLSVIEGLMRGVPCVMFDDLDAFDDVKGAEGIKAIRSRENTMVVKHILEALSCKWNIEAIRNEAMSYSIERMEERYLKVLRNSYGTI